MSNKEILANSLLVRGYHYLGFLIRESALVKWYVGSDNYSELHWFRQSLTYRGLALVGKPVGALLTGIGGLLHRLIHPSCTKEVLVNLRKDWQGRPLALLGLSGIRRASPVNPPKRTKRMLLKFITLACRAF